MTIDMKFELVPVSDVDRASRSTLTPSDSSLTTRTYAAALAFSLISGFHKSRCQVVEVDVCADTMSDAADRHDARALHRAHEIEEEAGEGEVAPGAFSHLGYPTVT